jgi:photosystem II stability/assembly factor-like uncharacterized protein
MQKSGTTCGLFGVAFLNVTRGWAVGRRGTILVTSDAGAHWRVQKSGTDKWLRAVAFPDATHGWAVGGQVSVGTDWFHWTRVILATTDGGAHWKLQKVPIRCNLSAVAFTDATHGWAVGCGWKMMNGVILATSDGGAHWKLQKSTSLNWQLHGVAFADTRHGWAVGGGVATPGTVLATSDGGIHWQAQTSRTDELLLGVAFPDATHGWAVGWGGTILATGSGGN